MDTTIQQDTVIPTDLVSPRYDELAAGLNKMLEDCCSDCEESFHQVMKQSLAILAEMEQEIARKKEDIRWLQTEAGKIYYDALTGIYNRRYFDENLTRVIKSLSRPVPTGELSLLMIDIDYFKNFNDTYGHTEGDKCLKLVAETLSQTTSRVDDFIARYGGEEFVAVLPNTNESGAMIVAEKMLKTIQDFKIPHSRSAIADYVTVSIGVTTGRIHLGQNAIDFIKQADAMLYQSKLNGRNRCTFGALGE